MIVEARTPAYPLNLFIDNLLYYEGYSPGHRLDRFLPNGNTEILFNLTETPQFIYDNETLQPIQVCRQAWVSGVRTRPITIPSGQGSRMVVVTARKGRAFPFYPLPVSELTDAVVPADLVFGRSVLELRERMLAAGAPAAGAPARILALVEAYLLQRAGGDLNPDAAADCIEYAVAGIVRRPDLLNLKRLSDQIGYSQKHFIDLFKRQVGVPPKRYLRIMRFQQAIKEIESGLAVPGRDIPWSRIAAESGYYDQAHFIHDFKGFSGFTPGEYLERKSATLNYIPVG